MDKRNIDKLEEPTLANRLKTGMHVGFSGVFRKRPDAKLRSAIGLTLPLIVPCSIGLLVCLWVLIWGSTEANDRALLGVVAYFSIIVAGVATSYGSIRYDMGGTTSETD